MAGFGGRRWWVYFGVVAVLATLSGMDPSGLKRHGRLASDIEGMRRENAHLATENARLAREVRALRTDPAAVERAVREELRYVRPGERVYVLGSDRGGGSP
jgi:cell division protein FtsB